MNNYDLEKKTLEKVKMSCRQDLNHINHASHGIAP